jgi:hypothetical protein
MTDQLDGWLTIREASLALGVSELTIRRRIKDGRLAHRLENGKYYVNPTAPAPLLAASPPSSNHREASQPSPPTGQPDQTSQLTDQSEPESSHARPAPVSIDLEVIFAEQARLAEAAGRALLLEEQLRQTEERHAVLQETLVSLATRNGWLESKLEEREKEVRLLTDSRRKRPWWKRLFLAEETGS